MKGNIMKKSIAIAIAGFTMASVAVASSPGATRTVIVAAESVVDNILESIVTTEVVEAQTADAEVSRDRIPGTLDTAEWGPWQLGDEVGGESTTEVITGDTVTERTGGQRMTHQVQEGDFLVTYEYYTEVVETSTTPQTQRVTTAAITREDTRECVVTINGVADLEIPTCD